MKITSVSICTVLLLAAVATASAPPFAAGQRWSYRARSVDTDSTLVIGRVEQHPSLGEIAHISIFDVQVGNPQRPDGVSRTLGHVPIAVSALRSSVLELVGDGAPAESFDQGYAIWSETVAEGKAGVFSIPVQEAVAHIEKTLNP